MSIPLNPKPCCGSLSDSSSQARNPHLTSPSIVVTRAQVKGNGDLVAIQTGPRTLRGFGAQGVLRLGLKDSGFGAWVGA